jgi:hypothetical protein
MSSFLYKGHSIIYGAALDGFTRQYLATGQLVWHGPKRNHGTHSFILSVPFATASEARVFALKEAIKLADERLAASERVHSNTEKEKPITEGNRSPGRLLNRELGG